MLNFIISIYFLFFKNLAIYANEILLIIIHVYVNTIKKNWYVFKQIMHAIMIIRFTNLEYKNYA